MFFPRKCFYFTQEVWTRLLNPTKSALLCCRQTVVAIVVSLDACPDRKQFGKCTHNLFEFYQRTRTSWRSAPLVLVPVPPNVSHNPSCQSQPLMLATTPHDSHNHSCQSHPSCQSQPPSCQSQPLMLVMNPQVSHKPSCQSQILMLVTTPHVWQSVAMCGNVWQSVAKCGNDPHVSHNYPSQR